MKYSSFKCPLKRYSQSERMSSNDEDSDDDDRERECEERKEKYRIMNVCLYFTLHATKQLHPTVFIIAVISAIYIYPFAFNGTVG